jgi:FtsZ-binding cell division protein ZapB
MKTAEEILKLKKLKIKELHDRENCLNKENSELDKEIEKCKFKKKKIAKAISKLVHYRNMLINKVYSINE